MRIVVSGTHASGKSTLISDFIFRHPELTALPDPFELVDEDDALGARLFASQLRIAAVRLISEPGRTSVIAERGPLDSWPTSSHWQTWMAPSSTSSSASARWPTRQRHSAP